MIETILTKMVYLFLLEIDLKYFFNVTKGKLV